jgi:hypothetical protein
MRGFLAALGPAHVHGTGLERDRRPLQVAELRHPESMPKTDEDHGRVAVAVAFGHLDQALDFKLGEVFDDRGPCRCCRAGAT